MKYVRSLLALALLLIVATGVRGDDLYQSPMILIAKSSLHGPYSKTVVLARPVGRGRHVGFIVNRPTPIRVAELLDDPRLSAAFDEPVFFGGPAYPNVVFLLVHRTERPAGRAIAVAEDTYLAVDAEAIEQVIEQDHRGGTRMFSGLVLWRAGELEHELERGFWHVVRHDPEIVFAAATEALWDKLVLRIRMF